MTIHPLIPEPGARIGPGLQASARFDGLTVNADDYAIGGIAQLNDDGTTHHQMDNSRAFSWQLSLDGTFALASVRFGSIPADWPFQLEGTADGHAVAIVWRWFRADGTVVQSLTTAAVYVFDPVSGLPLLLPSGDLLQRILDAVTHTY